MIQDKIITKDRKIFLYGLDVFSFAMRTILSNCGFSVDSYISDNPELIMQYKATVKSIKARYLNSGRDLIKICDIEEGLETFDEQVIVISASKNCPKMQIENLNYREGTGFFQIYDWERDGFKESMQGKRIMTLQEIQKVEKDMLYLIDRFCGEKGIRYWVCGGTLLGTMRHKGFIPWDDDIDIFLPWEDYLIFMKEFAYDKKYLLLSPDKVDRKNYYDFYSKLVDNRTVIREDGQIIRKVHPVAVDIFPLIGMPGNKDERRIFFRQYYEIERKIWEDFYSQNGNLGVYNKWYPQQRRFLEMYDFERADYAGVLSTAYKEKDCAARKVYDSTLRMPFEDIEVNVPAGYQEYLDNLYGRDWMRLPHEDKRVSHHNMEAFWL